MTPACYYLVVDAGALFHELGNWDQVIKHVNACLQANAATKNFRVETAYYVHDVDDWEEEMKRTHALHPVTYDPSLPNLGRGHLFELYDGC